MLCITDIVTAVLNEVSAKRVESVLSSSGSLLD